LSHVMVLGLVLVQGLHGVTPFEFIL